MTKRMRLLEMLSSVRQSLESVPEHRTGSNIQYQIADAGLAAFSVFYIQSPSFLSFQRQMEEKRAQNNARSLFGVKAIPSDGQIRSLLDPVETRYLRAPFWAIYELLQAKGYLEAYESVGGTLLCSLDGTQFFSSQKIKCANCTVLHFIMTCKTDSHSALYQRSRAF